MSSFTETNPNNTTDGTHRHETPTRRISTETKASYKTSELVAYVVVVIGVLIASAVADANTDFGAKTAWFFVTLLTIGYMISRGLAKSGSREPFDADSNR
jgi:urea transporter